MKRLVKTIVLLCYSSICMAQAPASDTVLADGYISRSSLEKYSWFKKYYDAYRPKKSVVNKLRKNSAVSLLVILGTWCSDSREQVPALIKVCDEAGIKDISFIGVNRKKISTKMNLDQYQVSFVPLIIVYQNKTEAGRIVETPVKTIEKDLLQMMH